jgi:hypothetical protein
MKSESEMDAELGDSVREDDSPPPSAKQRMHWCASDCGNCCINVLQNVKPEHGLVLCGVVGSTLLFTWLHVTIASGMAQAHPVLHTWSVTFREVYHSILAILAYFGGVLAMSALLVGATANRWITYIVPDNNAAAIAALSLDRKPHVRGLLVAWLAMHMYCVAFVDIGVGAIVRDGTLPTLLCWIVGPFTTIPLILLALRDRRGRRSKLPISACCRISIADDDGDLCIRSSAWREAELPRNAALLALALIASLNIVEGSVDAIESNGAPLTRIVTAALQGASVVAIALPSFKDDARHMMFAIATVGVAEFVMMLLYKSLNLHLLQGVAGVFLATSAATVAGVVLLPEALRLSPAVALIGSIIFLCTDSTAIILKRSTGL